MAFTVFGNGGGNCSQLCPRCLMEYNRTVIDSDSDTAPTLSSEVSSENGSLSLGNKKRKGIFTDRLDGAGGHGPNENTLFAFAQVDEDVKASSDDEVTSDEPANGVNVLGVSFHQLFQKLESKIGALGLPKEEAAAIFALISSSRTNIRQKKHPKPGDEIENLLRGIGQYPRKDDNKRNMGEALEDDRHPWGAMRKKSNESELVQDIPPAPKIIMRVLDDRSQARIREGNEGFLSGSNYMPLHTEPQRKTAIENHANWRNRRKTAFISATTNIQDLVYCLVPCIERRQKRNGLLSITKITLINGNADGMPILSMREEMNFYRCHDPYVSSQSNLSRIEKVEKLGKVGKEVSEKWLCQSWYDEEHLFLFRIPKEQIVKTWLWKDEEQWLIDNKTNVIKRWYDEVLVPEYNKHEHKRRFGSDESSIHESNCACCGR